MTAASWSTVNMARDSKTKALSIAALEVGALFLLTTVAFAGPPQGRLQSHMQSPIQAPAQHLDLRPPSHAVEAGNAAEKSPSAFPSMARRQNTAQEPVELPVLASDGMRTRPSVEEFARRVHREGLPVARLFETKSALVHLGLSPRGKPGLWLVQKTR
jgi:hypothetical protein